MTLFEVVLAMAILVAVAGGVLLTLRTAVETSVRVARVRNDAALSRGFMDLMRETLRTLPPQARFIAMRDRSTAQGYWTLVVDEPGRALGFGRVSFDRARVLVQTERQPGGLLALQLVAVPRVLRVGEKPVPLVLLADVESLEWRFFDPRSAAWQEQWPDSGFRPSAVELKMKRQGREEVSAVMWVSPGEPPGQSPGQGRRQP